MRWLSRLNPRNSLRAQISFASGAIALLLSLALSYYAAENSKNQIEKSEGESFARRAASMLDVLDRGMFERSREIQNAAILEDIRDADVPLGRKREILERLQSSFNAYAWIGICDVQGKGLVGTGKYLEGKDLAKRPWCSKGRDRAYLGDMHDALLLSKLLPNPSGEMFYLVDVAAPVIDKQGKLQGVLCGHIFWKWAEEVLDSKKTPGKDTFLLSQDGLVLSGPEPARSDLAKVAPLTMRTLRQSGQSSGYLLETWADGKTYLIGYAKSSGYRDYPGMGWISLMREDVTQAFTPARQLRQRILAMGVMLGLMFAWVGWVMAGRIAGPITRISQAADKVAAGELTYDVPMQQGDGEVAHLSSAIHDMVTSLTREIAERKKEEERIQYLANYDVLTGLPNRYLLSDRLEQGLSYAQGHQARLAVMFIDLDHFKNINDSLGHDVGDALLKMVADRLKQCLRRSDTIARLGGDEFVAVIGDLNSEDEATFIAEKMIASLTKQFVVGEYQLSVTPSIGVSIYPEDGETATLLLRNADLAMYRAKDAGRNRLEYYEAAMNAKAVQRLQLENDLRGALTKGQLMMYYQPKVNVSSGEVVGMEALLRWSHPQMGFISPAQFIPVAEESGLINEIGDWVLHQVAMQQRIWQSQGYRIVPVAVNLSVRQFGQKNFAEKIQSIVRNVGIPTHFIELELTESMLMDIGGESIQVMNKLNEAGFDLALDDFGTGYSSLSRLKLLPMKSLKIDQSFVRDIDTDENDEAIVNATAVLAHAMEMKVIAEGVETQAQLDFIRDLHCEEYQGYLFCRPVPESIAVTYLHRESAT